VLTDVRKNRDVLGDLQTEESPSLVGMQKACINMYNAFAAVKQLKIVS
jgi:hypothetical protein